MTQATQQKRITDIWKQEEFTSKEILDPHGQISPQGMKELFEGQVKINGALVEAIWAVLNVAKPNADNKGVYGTDVGLKGETLIETAERLTKKVADIKPPGCGK